MLKWLNWMFRKSLADALIETSETAIQGVEAYLAVRKKIRTEQHKK